MGRFIVEVVFVVELEDVTQGGKRLHELSHAASALGFEMRRGQVREDDGRWGSLRDTPVRAKRS